MIERMNVYKCSVCGNIVEVLHAGGGDLVCCGKNMDILKENTTDDATEKHGPVLEKSGNGTKVAVGSVAHPMEEKHFIQWIELIHGEASCRKFLKPGDKPEAVFDVPFSDKLVAREYCNLHGHWKK